MATGPGDQPAVGTVSRGHPWASDADRGRVIDALLDAFVEGRLTKDELGVRAGRALVSRTHAELAAITAGIPAGLTEPPPPAAPARPAARKPVNRKAVAWAACVAILLPALGAAFLTYYGGFIVLFLLAFAGLTAATAH